MFPGGRGVFVRHLHWNKNTLRNKQWMTRSMTVENVCETARYRYMEKEINRDFNYKWRRTAVWSSIDFQELQHVRFRLQEDCGFVPSLGRRLLVRGYKCRFFLGRSLAPQPGVRIGMCLLTRSVHKWSFDLQEHTYGHIPLNKIFSTIENLASLNK